VAEAVFAVEHGRPSRTDIDRLARAAAGDRLAARALALHAKRSGDLRDADRRFAALIDESESPGPSLLNNAANVRLALGRTEEAIELYEAAAHRGHSVAVLFNLSLAYGSVVQLDQQNLALAEAQLIDPVALDALTDLHASSPRRLAADLPVEVGLIRARLEDPAAARQAASALRRQFAPGWLGTSPAHSAVGVALAALLGWGVALALRKLTEGREGGSLHAGVARLLRGSEATDPFLRMVRLAALRERQARIDKMKFALSVLVPGAAGVFSRQPILGLLGSMLFASALVSWWLRDGLVVDPVSVGAGASLLFSTVAVASGAAYAAVIAVAIALWEGS
jgi:tetratricopeptide (TPR) repeat protein